AVKAGEAGHGIFNCNNDVTYNIGAHTLVTYKGYFRFNGICGYECLEDITVSEFDFKRASAFIDGSALFAIEERVVVCGAIIL
ncbi:hypothetical protein DK853_38270, partial [Klebsiella oxytoca]